MEGKKVWGRKQIQEPRRCLKCQCFRKHKAIEYCSIHDVCGRCGSQHRTNLCNESNKEALVCSNCKAAKNNLHTGHGAVDRSCLIFLNRSHKMNKKRSENKYKYYCTNDPATLEINDSCKQEEHNTRYMIPKEIIKCLKR